MLFMRHQMEEDLGADNTGKKPVSRDEPAAKLDAVPFYHNIRGAFGQPGCPLCRLLTASADRYLDAVLWELVNDPGVRSELNQSRGYCQQHGWMLVRTGSALGIAILMRGVVKTLLEQLASEPVEAASQSMLQSLRHSVGRKSVSKTTEKVAAALSPQTPCPVCVHVGTLEEHYIATLVAHLDEPGALAEVYHTSSGLCLPHFRKSLAHASSSKDARELISAQQAVWQRLYDELGEFIRKKDSRFKDEPFGPERDSWRRALESISGPSTQREIGD